ncbi:ATP-binding protein [Streptomyces sp. NBC_01477]|uniref:ATP-binding protein n=1 Tax=Streptomyces sp. NBC_01477 TaxID=2976015 RepID=UPI002E2EC9D9|nr:ATP-binding protein [Streptomyces sp. NBC_01477]
MPLPEPTDRPALDIRFSRRPEHVARARRATRLTLTSWGVPDEAVEAAVLVVSELVTNAVRHARSTPGRDIGLRITRREDHRVRVEVADAGDGLPSPRTAFPDDESHRGLPLVAALAVRHGVGPRPHGIGKTVWADIDTSPTAPGADA